MIYVLVVDDDSRKQARVKELIAELLGDEVTVDLAANVAEGAERMRARAYDLVVLDLNLPARAGEEPRPEVGTRLLEMARRNQVKVPTHIIGLTAYEDIVRRLRPSFEEQLWHIVLYENASDEWFEAIGRRLVHIVDCKHPRQDDQYSCDLAIVTALTSVELEAVLELPANWSRRPVDGDDAEYHVGEFARPERPLRVVAAAAYEVGMPAATGLSMKLIAEFKPRVLAMCGIAAGVKGSFGDILVADRAWDYGSGKNKHVLLRVSKFYPAPTQIPMHPALKAKLALFCTKRASLDRIHGLWRGTESRAALEVRMGPIASGAAVLENRPFIEDIVARDRKVVGIEMETYGVFMAAHLSRAPKPMAMSAKSICDFGDKDKTDEYQRYAAFTSARFVYEFALDSL
jgi:nucleoside phosphorylase/CheY-like chemotaxis protein